MATSNLQEKTKERLRLLFKTYDIKENHRPRWLRNPKTKMVLELDFWLPDLNIAIEVQGRQHLEFVPFFHGSAEKFQDQLDRDILKKKACKNRGVLLYEIFSIEDIDRLIESVKDHSPELAYDLLRRHTAIKALSYYAGKLYVEMRQKPPAPIVMAKYSSKITHIATHYNIPLKSIEPDFNITKAALGYSTKPTIRVKLLDKEGNTLRKYWAAVMSVDGTIAKLKWVHRWGYRQVLEIDFDLLADCQVNPSPDEKWVLKPDSLRRALNNPDGLIYNLVAGIFANREDLDWQPKDPTPSTDVSPIQNWSPVKRDRVIVWDHPGLHKY